MGKSTLGDLTKTAKEAAAKKGLMKGDMSQQQHQPQQQQHTAQQQHQQQLHNQQQQLHYEQQQQQYYQQQQQQQGPPGNSLVSHGSGSGGLIAGTGRDFFSSFSNEITGITSSTSSMFSGLFGKSTS